MSDPTANPGPAGQPEPPRFDPDAEHQQRPRLRPIRGFAARHGEQTYLGLADAQQISNKVVFTTPAAQAVLPHMTGEHDLDAIVERVGQGLTRDWLEQFIAQLEGAGLIEGPTFQSLLTQLRETYDTKDVLPPATTAQFAEALLRQQSEAEEGRTEEEPASDESAQQPPPQYDADPKASRELIAATFDEWIGEALKEAKDPSFDELPKAVVAPHIDYARGWHNYAHVYGRMRVVDRPDRVVVLGTNHFGFSTGVAGCDKGFETPLGVCPLDVDFKERLCAALGEENARRLFEHRFDHEREHSIELQIAWIQHVFGDAESGDHPRVFGALVHDPARNNGESYDDAGLGLMPFIEALKQTIDGSEGRTLVVASADLSHVGPQFGDQTPLAGDDEKAQEFRNKVVNFDREALQTYVTAPAEELVASIAWRQNPTRWCSVGNLVAAKKAVDPETTRLLHYGAAMDSQGMGLVSSCAIAMF